MNQLEFILEDKIDFKKVNEKESYTQMLKINQNGRRILDLQKCVNYEQSGINITIYLNDDSNVRDDLIKLINHTCKTYPSILENMYFGIKVNKRNIDLHPDNFSKPKYYKKLRGADSFYWESNFFDVTYYPDKNIVVILSVYNIIKPLTEFLLSNNKLTRKDKKNLDQKLTELLAYLDSNLDDLHVH